MPVLPTPEKLFIASFPTARTEDVYLYLHVQTQTSGYRTGQYGDPLPPQFQKAYPDHRLVLIVPNRDAGDGWSIAVYANVRAKQDEYNYDTSFPEGSNAFPTIERTYILLRSEYAKTGPLAVGTADPGKMPPGDETAAPMFPGAILCEAERMVEGTGDQFIDSLFVRVIRKFKHIPALTDPNDLNAAKVFGYLVEYPYGVLAYPRVTWKIPCTADTPVTPLSGTCPIPGYDTSTFGTGSQPLVAVEQSYKNDKGVVVALLRVYECNPGPIVVESDFEPRTGTPVRITKQIVAAASIPATPALLNAEMNGYTSVGMDNIDSGAATTLTPHGLAVGQEIYFDGMTGLTDVVNGSDKGAGAYFVLTTPTTSSFTFSMFGGGTPMSGAGAMGGTLHKRTTPRGTVIEYKPMGMDALRAIRVTSSIDMSKLDFLQGAADTVYESTETFSFPDVLNNAEWVNAELYTANTFWDFNAVPSYDLTEGYRGPCRARITERYTSNPAAPGFLAALPTPLKIQGGFSSVGYAFFKGLDDGRGAALARVFQVPNSIHGGLSMGSSGIPAFVDGGRYFSSIPATPTTATPTDYFVADVKPEKWKFGLWVYRIIEIIHPE